MIDGRDIKVGDIQRAATEVIRSNSRPVLIYLAIFVPLTSLANWLDVQMGFISPSETDWGAQVQTQNGLIGIVVLLASLAGQYLLFEKMLFGDHVAADRVTRILGFIGLAFVSFLGVGLATLFLIVPGLFVASRWLMCPAIYVGEGKGVFESLGESWRRTKGHTGTVMLAIVLLVLIAIVLGLLLGGFSLAGGSASSGYLADGVMSEIWTVLVIALSVGTYNVLVNPGARLADTFA